MSENGYGLPLSRLSCLAMVEEEGKVWFVRVQANGLYEFDKKEKRTKLLMSFPNYSIDNVFLYFAIEKVGGILVLAPAAASKIVFYDLMADKADYVELIPAENERKVKYTGECDFFKCFRHGDCVYLLGYEYPAILKIDVNTKQIVYFTDWVEKVEQRIKKMSVGMGYVSDYVVVEDYVWVLCECANTVLCLDLRTDEIRIVDICSDLDIQGGICFDGGFWVTGYNENANKLLKYDCSFMLENEIEICSGKKNGEEYSLSLQDNHWEIYPIIDLSGRLLLFSVYPRHVYEYDKSLQKIWISPVFEKLIEIQDEKLHEMGILVPRKKGNLICFITGNDFMWNEYDFVHNTLTRYEVRTETDDDFLQKKSKFMAGRIFRENTLSQNLCYKLTLPRFLSHIAYVPEQDNMEKGNSVGRKIYEKNCREVPSR